ncbi:hypothetical protein [Hyphococcus sp.]|uniref:hypothetical protein n=1 Tax=Hyphococcus sp. TaxID=2038636 RepID=UPI00208D286B|nr:MAG: hypothetical protein DHS20C04_28530 [Marinicaulis sp.]
MSATNLILIVASLLCAGILFHPKLLRAPLWRATVTPLASIIGSGFLVAGPILAHAAGTKAWLAMLSLCALAYLFGAAIRYNILHVEPNLDNSPARFVAGLERLSQVSLSLAYFVSVAYYINLFAAFGLRFGDVVDPFWIRTVATVVISALGLVGLSGGLKMLERLEIGAVGLKLCVIGGLLAALILAGIIMAVQGRFEWRAPIHPHGWEEVRVLLGLVIMVQGFETSRYLGAEYEAIERVKTMRWAQWIASAIYIVFVLLITSYFKNGLPPQGGETAIIDMLAPLGMALGPMIIVAALASQMSAAVADMNGAGGLISESSGRKLPVNLGNLVTALVAILIIWSADIFEIITYASKAFVIYYGLQSFQAAFASYKNDKTVLTVLFGIAVLIALIVLIFAIPASI